MSGWVWAGIAVAVVVGLYGLHRLALWMESRGWLFYVNREPSGASLGNAALGIQSMFEAGSRHALEVRQELRVEQDEDGGPADPGSEELPPWMRLEEEEPDPDPSPSPPPGTESS